jgi:hypothetical protein
LKENIAMATAPVAPGPFATSATAAARDPRYDNKPPLEDQVMLEFDEDLEREGIKDRIAELLANAGKCPESFDDEATAGKVGDFIRLARDVEKRVNDAREKHNRPLLNAQRGLKGRADAVLQPLLQAGATLRSRLNAFTTREANRRAEEQRQREAEAQRAREALEREHVAPEVINQVVETPKPEAAPIARGDYGSRVGATTVWNFEIESMRQVPDRYLKHPKVKEALESVIRAAIRTEKVREIKGVRIWEGTQAVVR